MILFGILLSLFVFVLYFNKKLGVELNILQIHSYENRKMIEWMNDRRTIKTFFKEFLLFLALIPMLAVGSLMLSELVLVIIFLFFLFKVNNGNYKKPLVKTDRVKRLRGTTWMLGTILFALLFLSLLWIPESYVFFTIPTTLELLCNDLFQTLNINFLLFLSLQILICFVLSKFSHWFLAFSNILLGPVEKKINRKYYDEARVKLMGMRNLKIIGITGSYGKTSTKFIVHDILSDKFRVCKTPSSFNTLLGVVRTIREELKSTDEVFVVEMGARKRNDIKEICDLVRPNFGILTAIGNQHLESFKNIDVIKETKYELIKSLEGDKVAILNVDNEHVKDIVEKEKLNEMQHETVCYSLKYDEADYYAENVRYTGTGAVFDLKLHDGSKTEISTRLLGLYNVYNVLAGIAVAHKLGMSLPEIQKAVLKVKPVEHRLEIIKTHQNITVIDDSFNANPEGTKEALEVLVRMEGNKKIIVTPGMIELGEKQYQFNLEFGERCARMCDYTIMVGHIQTKPMYDAFKNIGIPEDKYFVAKDLNEATEKLKGILAPGDVVLYENDLPEDF